MNVSQEPISPTHGKTKLLIICSENETTRNIERMLLNVSGIEFETSHAADFTKAFKALVQSSFQVCLVVEGLDPNQTLNFLHTTLLKQRGIPMILLTRHEKSASALEALRLGASDFISLPHLDPAKLERSIRYTLERHRSTVALQKNEELLRSILDNTLDGITIMALDGRHLYVSSSIESIAGYSREEALSLNLFSLVHPEDMPRAMERLQWASGHPGAAMKDEFRCRHKDGTWRLLEVIGKCEFFHAFNAQAVILNYRDITDRKKAQVTAERLSMIVESSNDAIFTVSREGAILSWNPSARNIYGYPAEEIAGRHFSLLMAPAEAAEFQEDLKAVLSGKSQRASQTTHLTQVGRPLPVSLTLSPIQEMDGKIDRVSVIARDISEIQKSIEAAKRLTNLLEYAPVAIISTDRDGRVTLWNRTADKLFGFRAEEMMDQKADILEPPDQQGEMARLRNEILSGGPPLHYQARRQKKDGSAIDLDYQLFPAVDASGKIVGLTAIALDISEKLHVHKVIREAEARFRHVFEGSPIGMALVTVGGKMRIVNPKFCQIMGYPASELTDRSFIEITHPEDAPKDMELFQKLLRGELQSYEMEKRYRHKDGRWIWGHLVVSMLRGLSHGEPLVLGMMEDITDQKNARETRDRLSDILNFSHDAIIGADIDGKITHWNKGAEEMFGYSAAEVLGQTGELITPKDRQPEVKFLREGVAQGRAVSNFETVRQRKNGSLIDVSVNASPFKDDSGRVTAISVIIRDITESKRAREAKDRLADILENSPYAITTTDINGFIIEWNHASENLFGFKAGEILGLSSQQLIPDDQIENLKILRNKVLQGQVLSNVELVRMRKDGAVITISATLIPYRDNNGNITGMTTLSMDVTEQKRAEEAFKQQEEQVKLAQKMEAIGRLAGGVAHDFNNLLSVIGGNADFILESPTPLGPHREELEEIKNAVKSGADLTRQMLLLGQKQVTQAKAVQLNDHCQEMNRMLKRLIDPSIELGIDLDPDLKWTYADPAQIQQVILNLVLNARDAMPKGGSLRIQTRNETGPVEGSPSQTGAWVKLSISDTGIGMNPEIQKKIFEPFFTTKGAKGTGLGLSTVYAILQQWKGHIELQSAPGKGSVFSLYFPVREEEAKKNQRSQQAALIPEGNETILVAEDDAAVRKIVVRTLKKYRYKVLEAENGVEAIKTSWNYKEKIDLLLTDTVMPKINGRELAEELSRSRPKMKVMFMSGYPREILSEEGAIDPSIHLLRKPFTSEELVQEIRKVLDEKKK